VETGLNPAAINPPGESTPLLAEEGMIEDTASIANHGQNAASSEVEENLSDLKNHKDEKQRKLNPLTKLLSLSDSEKLTIKLGVSIVMFASLFLLGKFDLSKSWEAAKEADPRFLILAISLYLGSIFLNAYRWKILASAVGLDRPFLKLAQFCFVGLFFNLFLPSTVGGDFSRGYYLSKGTNNYKSAFYSVLADRAVGISVLFLFATAGLLLGPGGAALPWQLKAPIFLCTFGTFVVVPLLPRLTKAVLGESNWISRQLNDSQAQVYWKDKNLILASLALSVIMQVIVVGCHIAIGLALGLSIPLWYYFVFYPSVAVLGFITPSFNGIGIREWAYTYFLTLQLNGLQYVDQSKALTFAIMLLALTTASSLIGGLVYLAGHFTVPVHDEAA
jgi:uncharacterized membrane protein YbhN (UPF0104 family)